MVTAFKRSKVTRSKTTWINKTTRNNGTSSSSTSNKAGNTTTNVSATGVVKKRQNNNGMIQYSTWNPNTANKPKKSKPVGLSDAQRNKAIAKMFSSNKPKTAKAPAKHRVSKSTGSKSYSSSHTHVDYAPTEYDLETLIGRRLQNFDYENDFLDEELAAFVYAEKLQRMRPIKEKIMSFVNSALDDNIVVVSVSSIIFPFIVYATMSFIGFMNAMLLASAMHVATVSAAHWRNNPQYDIFDIVLEVIAATIVIGIPVGIVLTILNFFSII